MSTDSENSLFTPAHQRWMRRLTLSTIAILIGMLVVDQPLKTSHSPLGIISLQVAGTTQAAKLIINNWSPKDRLAAAFGLGLDYLLLTSYSALLFLGCRWAALRWMNCNPSRGNRVAWLSWAAIAAGLLDAVENVVLLVFLQSDGRSVLYPLAFWCAVPKFLLILLVICGWISGTRAPREEAPAKPAPAKKT